MANGDTTTTGGGDGVQIVSTLEPSNPIPANDLSRRQGGANIVEVFTTEANAAVEVISAVAKNQNFKNDESIPSAMVFPEVLNTIENIRPVLQIKCIGGPNNEKEVTFPCPIGFGVTDGASYNDTELGQFGQAANNVTQKFIGSETAGEGVLDVLRDQYGADSNLSIGGKIGQGIAGAVLTGLGLAREDIPTDTLKGAAAGVATALGIAVNKNVTTEFTGVATRSFSFQYKLVPSSRKEGKVIDEITRFFRQGVYPMKERSTGGIILRYPPKWELRLLKKIGGERIPSVPAIAQCYLESFATTYNGSNSFHENGLPVDTDITISFKETRSLTREDIKRLEENGDLKDT